MPPRLCVLDTVPGPQPGAAPQQSPAQAIFNVKMAKTCTVGHVVLSCVALLVCVATGGHSQMPRPEYTQHAEMARWLVSCLIHLSLLLFYNTDATTHRM